MQKYTFLFGIFDFYTYFCSWNCINMQNISQGGAAAARLAHDQQAGSSILPPATINHSG